MVEKDVLDKSHEFLNPLKNSSVVSPRFFSQWQLFHPQSFPASPSKPPLKLNQHSLPRPTLKVLWACARQPGLSTEQDQTSGRSSAGLRFIIDTFPATPPPPPAPHAGVLKRTELPRAPVHPRRQHGARRTCGTGPTAPGPVATLPLQPPKRMMGGSSLAHGDSGGTEATFRAAGGPSLLLTCTWGLHITSFLGFFLNRVQDGEDQLRLVCKLQS